MILFFSLTHQKHAKNWVQFILSWLWTGLYNQYLNDLVSWIPTGWLSWVFWTSKISEMTILACLVEVKEYFHWKPTLPSDCSLPSIGNSDSRKLWQELEKVLNRVPETKLSSRQFDQLLAYLFGKFFQD